MLCSVGRIIFLSMVAYDIRTMAKIEFAFYWNGSSRGGPMGSGKDETF